MAVYTQKTVNAEEKQNKQMDHRGRHVHHWHHAHGHHQHLHGKGAVKTKKVLNRALADRAVGNMVHATIDNKLVSWINEYGGAEFTTANPAHTPSPSTSAITTAFPYPDSEPTSPRSGHGNDSGSWARQAYFDAASHKAEGIAFLNHFGGENGIPGTTEGGPAYVTCNHANGICLADMMIALELRYLTLHQMVNQVLPNHRCFTML